MESFCEYICEANATYLNTAIISQLQVLDLLKKLWEMIYGRKPEKPVVEKAKPPSLDNAPSLSLKDKPSERAAEAADQNRRDNQRKAIESKVETDSEYEDDAFGKDDDDDDWDADFGENDLAPKKASVPSKETAAAPKSKVEPNKLKKEEDSADAQRRNLYFGMNDDDDGKDSDNDLLENIPSIGMD